MWAEIKKGFRDLDGERVLDVIGLERKHTTAERLVPAFALFGAGILIGIGVGLLFAPRSGRELRSELQEKVEEGVPNAAEAIRSAVEQSREENPELTSSASNP